MDAVNELIKNAEEGIIFLMFQPGGSSILDTIAGRQTDGDGLFVKGVISTMDKNDQDQAKVTLIQRGDKKVAKFRIVQPQGLQEIGKWAAEVSRACVLKSDRFCDCAFESARDRSEWEESGRCDGVAQFFSGRKLEERREPGYYSWQSGASEGLCGGSSVGLRPLQFQGSGGVNESGRKGRIEVDARSEGLAGGMVSRGQTA